MSLYMKRNLLLRHRLVCPYAAPYFSVHDYLAQPALGYVVCGWNLRIQHEPEQVTAGIAEN